MDSLVTGLIVLAAVALVVWRAVRFLRGLVSPSDAGASCGASCASCPLQGVKGKDGRCLPPPPSWDV